MGMQAGQRGRALILAAFLPALAAAQGHEHHHHEAAAPAAYGRSEARYSVPDVELVDARGGRVSLRQELDAGGPVLLNFIFTSCPAVCPVMSATFARVQDLLAAERPPVRLVSVSIDPDFDTPARLQDYAARHGAGPRWHLLTGRRDDALAVARAFDAWRGDKMNHVPATYLRVAPGRPWLRLDGFASPEALVQELRAAGASLGERTARQ